MKTLNILATTLLVVGGLNWGLVGLAGFDLVAFVTGAGAFGEMNVLGMVIYALVGLAAVYRTVGWKAIQHRSASAPIGAGLVACALVLAGPALACGGGKTKGIQAQAASTAGMPADAPAAPGNLLEVAAKAGSFQTLAAAIKAAGLESTLQGKGPFTVFAPTDAAFAKLPKETLDGLLKDKEALTRVLTYHVVPGRLEAAQVLRTKEAKTVQGQAITFSAGKEPMVNNARIIATDVAANNGVIHVIDTVILPR